MPAGAEAPEAAATASADGQLDQAALVTVAVFMVTLSVMAMTTVFV